MSAGFFILLVVSVAIGWLIGKRKNRPVAGALWALVLGPLGWLLMFLLPAAE